MTVVEYDGKQYDMKRNVYFGELVELAEIETGIKHAENNKSQLQELWGKRLQLTADILNGTLGLETEDLEKMTPMEAFELVNNLVERSSTNDRRAN